MAKLDEGHILTDEELVKLEKRISAVYKEAAEELQKTIDSYFAQFEKEDEKKGKELENEKITDQDYKDWRMENIVRGERYRALRDQLAERITNADEVAISYVNDATPGIYSLNRNYAAYTIEQLSGNVGFTLWDEQTVKRLIVEQPDLMPYYPEEKAIKRGIDLAYGKKQITAEITSSILQGKSIPKMAKSLRMRIADMGKTSAIRAARTSATGAQNAGRQDSYVQAAKMGIKVRKRWIATKDRRTRHDHGVADGQIVDYDQPFEVGGYAMLYPGDPSGPVHEVYNCRCSMRTVEAEGIEAEPRQMRVKNSKGKYVLVNEMTFSEWQEWVKNRGS